MIDLYLIIETSKSSFVDKEFYFQTLLNYENTQGSLNINSPYIR